MGFRTVVVKNRCKLEYSLNYLVIRNQEGEQKIHISEIEAVILQSTQISITTALVANLLENHINIMICDEKSNPVGEILSYNGIYDSYDKINSQFSITEDSKDKCWKEIISKKIYNQSRVHEKYSKNEEVTNLIKEYLQAITDGDRTNREGHSAKVYFNSLFGKDFSRDQKNEINMYLDYGYTILLSCFNRVIKSIGYYIELGIHHIGRTNPFNLSCDFMEPLRPLVDSMVLSKQVNPDNYKREFINILNKTVICDDKEMYLENAVKVYCKSIFASLIDEKPSGIKFISYDI